MGAGYTCMKWLFIFINLIFLVFGLAGFGVSIYLFVDSTLPLHFTQEQNEYLISTVILLLASIILLLVAILGIYSVCKDARRALVASFCLLLIIVVAEIAAVVWGYINRDSLEAHILHSVKNTVKEDYDRDENARRLFDTIQSKMECCGVQKPNDWTRGKDFNMAVSANPTTYSIPKSCCRPNATDKCNEFSRNLRVGDDPNKDIIFDKGCYTLIMGWLNDSLCCILISGGVILAIQILGLILGLILACSMNRSHRYKA